MFDCVGKSSECHKKKSMESYGASDSYLSLTCETGKEAVRHDQFNVKHLWYNLSLKDAQFQHDKDGDNGPC